MVVVYFGYVAFMGWNQKLLALLGLCAERYSARVSDLN